MFTSYFYMHRLLPNPGTVSKVQRESSSIFHPLDILNTSGAPLRILVSDRTCRWHDFVTLEVCDFTVKLHNRTLVLHVSPLKLRMSQQLSLRHWMLSNQSVPREVVNLWYMILHSLSYKLCT